MVEFEPASCQREVGNFLLWDLVDHFLFDAFHVHDERKGLLAVEVHEKTELAKVISEYLRWPLLAVDPSYLVKEGLDRVQAMANRLFSILTMTEQVVILLDEFDELGRNRARNEELLSRFITTAMLPKLAAINKERRSVFLLATNYVRGFDSAFRRGGRFDMLLQIMPPNLDSKLNADEQLFPKWKSALSASLEKLSGKSQTEARQRIGELTFAETERIVHELDGLTDLARIETAIEAAWKACTLERDYDSGSDSDQNDPSGSGSTRKKWRDICAEEAREIRLPWVRPRTMTTK
jgi:SpoVK/Ycf46/Vps4 family AAA+-type ATPase